MAGAELAAPLRGAGLEQQRCALGRRLAQVGAGHVVVLAVVVDGVHPGRIGVDPGLPVGHDGVVVPAPLPQLVADLEVLVGQVVAGVVGRESVVAEVGGPVRQVGGDDVPGHPPPGQVVEGRQLTGEGVRVGLVHRTGEGQPEVLGHCGQGGHEQHRVVGRDLHGLAQDRLGASLVDVVEAGDVGQEEGVEPAPLQQLGQLEPRFQRGVLPLAGVVPGPQSLLDVGHAVHGEGVEEEAAGRLGAGRGHRPTLGRAAVRFEPPGGEPLARFGPPQVTCAILEAMLFEDWGASDDERSDRLPGDELLVDPPVSATRSISLLAEPDEVFGWLAQMGFGRAGWYSYDLVDNLGRRSATELRPSWQVAAAGDRVPGGPIAFDVTHLARPEHLVLAVLDQRFVGHRVDFTLAYRLRPLAGPAGGTRLVSRARIRVDGPLGRPLTAAIGLGDGIMVRRQLLGLAERCGRVDR